MVPPTDRTTEAALRRYRGFGRRMPFNLSVRFIFYLAPRRYTYCLNQLKRGTSCASLGAYGRLAPTGVTYELNIFKLSNLIGYTYLLVLFHLVFRKII